jgi:hypothetical protein
MDEVNVDEVRTEIVGSDEQSLIMRRPLNGVKIYAKCPHCGIVHSLTVSDLQGARNVVCSVRNLGRGCLSRFSVSWKILVAGKITMSKTTEK